MHTLDSFAWTILAEAPADNSPGIIGLLPMFVVIGLLFYCSRRMPSSSPCKVSGYMRSSMSSLIICTERVYVQRC